MSTRAKREATLAGAVIVATLASAAALLHCGSLINSPYTARQQACVDEAGTRAQADACRCRVKASFGNPCTDAGGDQ